MSRSRLVKIISIFFFIIFFTFSGLGLTSFDFLNSEIMFEEHSTPKSDDISNSSNSSRVDSSIFLLFKIFLMPPDILSDDLENPLFQFFKPTKNHF